ncbi:hypothetical protein [Altericista sp. CCNU0014]|uniref:hypothetical protein n=1 Tax=Altericista sp. CCNU0014 TaxID=3082949 RepID=UPI00384A5C5D
MEDVRDVLNSPTLNRLVMFAYLVPVFGMVPAVWILTRRKSDRHHRNLSRLSVTLGLAWILGSLAFNASLGAIDENAIGAQIWMTLFDSVFSSSYFVASLWLMVRLWKRQSLDLPGFSSIAKHLP